MAIHTEKLFLPIVATHCSAGGLFVLYLMFGTSPPSDPAGFPIWFIMLMFGIGLSGLGTLIALMMGGLHWRMQRVVGSVVVVVSLAAYLAAWGQEAFWALVLSGVVHIAGVLMLGGELVTRPPRDIGG